MVQTRVPADLAQPAACGAESDGSARVGHRIHAGPFVHTSPSGQACPCGRGHLVHVPWLVCAGVCPSDALQQRGAFELLAAHASLCLQSITLAHRGHTPRQVALHAGGGVVSSRSVAHQHTIGKVRAAQGGWQVVDHHSIVRG